MAYIADSKPCDLCNEQGTSCTCSFCIIHNEIHEGHVSCVKCCANEFPQHYKLNPNDNKQDIDIKPYK